MKYSVTTIVAVVAIIAIAPLTEAVTTTAESHVDRVTVYTGEARITRTATLQLPAGNHTAVFKDVPRRVWGASLQASVSGLNGAAVIGLNQRQGRSLESVGSRIAQIQSRIDSLKIWQRPVLADRQDVLKRRRTFLEQISETSGDIAADQMQMGRIDAVGWSKAYDFFGANLQLLTDSLRLVERALSDIDKEVKGLQKRINQVRQEAHDEAQVLEVDLSLPEEGQYTVALSYVIGDVGWRPLYNARLSINGDSLDIGYFAEIRQATGEDWNNVSISLSTTSLSRENKYRDFDPWKLDAVGTRQPPTIKVTAERDVIDKFQVSNDQIFIRGGRSGETSTISVPIGDPLGGLPASVKDLVSVSNNATGYAAEFTVIRRDTIPSDREGNTRVPIARLSLPATVSLLARPRQAPAAYRMVTVTNNDEAVFLPGSMSLFAGSDYLGRSKLDDLVTPGEEFEIPYGTDDNIKVERRYLTRMRESSKDKQRRSHTVEITLTNQGPVAARITVEEPFPVSEDSRVKVKVKDIEPEPLETDAEGKTVWEVDLQPGAKKIIAYKYEVEYPKNVKVPGF